MSVKGGISITSGLGLSGAVPWPSVERPDRLLEIFFSGYVRIHKTLFYAVLKSSSTAEAIDDEFVDVSSSEEKTECTVSQPAGIQYHVHFNVVKGGQRFGRSSKKGEISFTLQSHEFGKDPGEKRHEYYYWIELVDFKRKRIRFYPLSQHGDTAPQFSQLEQLRWRRILSVAERENKLRSKLIALCDLSPPTVRLGAGGFGTVYRAVRKTTGNEVAVKMVHTMIGGELDNEAVCNVLNEALILISAAGRYSLSFEGIGWDSKAAVYPALFIVTELLQGGSLRDVLYKTATDGGRIPRSPGKMTPATIQVVTYQLIDSLYFLHTRKPQIIHRDLKPENILFVKSPEELEDGLDLKDPIIKLIDFGIAKQAGSDIASRKAISLTANVGTESYRAPEIITESTSPGRPAMRGIPYDTSVDMYAAGLVLWEMLARKTPFSGTAYDALHKWDIQKAILNGHRPLFEENFSTAFRHLVWMLWHPCADLRFSAEEALSFIKQYYSVLMSPLFSRNIIPNNLQGILNGAASCFWMSDQRYAALLEKHVGAMQASDLDKQPAPKRYAVDTFLQELCVHFQPVAYTRGHTAPLRVLGLLVCHEETRKMLVGTDCMHKVAVILQNHVDNNERAWGPLGDTEANIEQLLVACIHDMLHPHSRAGSPSRPNRTRVTNRLRSQTSLDSRPLSMFRERMLSEGVVKNNPFMLINHSDEESRGTNSLSMDGVLGHTRQWPLQHDPSVADAILSFDGDLSKSLLRLLVDLVLSIDTTTGVRKLVYNILGTLVSLHSPKASDNLGNVLAGRDVAVRFAMRCLRDATAASGIIFCALMDNQSLKNELLTENAEDVWISTIDEVAQSMAKTDSNAAAICKFQKSLIRGIPQACVSQSSKTSMRHYKVVLCGDSGVGKSSIFKRFCGLEFKDGCSTTVGLDTSKIVVSVPSLGGDKNTSVEIGLWDTGGQERYRAIARSYLKDADACVLVYPLQLIRRRQSHASETDKEHKIYSQTTSEILDTLGLEYWVDLAHESSVKPGGPLWLLLGNKADLGYRQAVYDAVAEFRDGINIVCDHEIISAKESKDERFQQILRKLVRKLMGQTPSCVRGLTLAAPPRRSSNGIRSCVTC